MIGLTIKRAKLKDIRGFTACMLIPMIALKNKRITEFLSGGKRAYVIYRIFGRIVLVDCVPAVRANPYSFYMVEDRRRWYDKLLMSYLTLRVGIEMEREDILFAYDERKV